MVILCIDLDSDSDVVIEEGEGDFKERCIIIKGEERNVEEEAEQADRQMTNSLNSPLRQGPSLEHLWPLDRTLKTKMRPFPVPQPRTLTEKRWRGSS